MSEDWRFGDANLTIGPMGLDPRDNSLGDLMGLSARSSVSMVDSFCPTLWDHPNSQQLGFSDNDLHTSTSASNSVVIRKGLPVTSRIDIDRELGMGWNPPNSIPRGDGVGILPQSLSQFQADPAFIERAARFSCINSGNFNYMMNPFNISKPLNLNSKSGGPIRGPQEIHSADGLKSFLGAQSQNNEPNMAEVAKDVSISIECNEMEKKSFLRGCEQGKQGTGVFNNESDEAEFSSDGCREEPSILESVGKEPSLSLAKGIGMKKRKRTSENVELNRAKGASQLSGEASMGDTETKEKVDHNPTSAKDGSQALDSPKEDYIHVRARRGQATNSHSLAERVRREKISERMKFLQELVPGCNKVTGKAVMLDEIINYVQSLQRQVEFLSMKIATVNPMLDFEGILAKDIRQSSGGPSTMRFSQDMSMDHPSYQGMIQGGIPGIGNPSDALRRTLHSQLTAMDGGYKELVSQIPNVWDDELNNVIKMSFGANIPFNSHQDLNGSLSQGNMKIEL